MKSSRPITDRIQDKLWSIRARHLAREMSDTYSSTSTDGSISGKMQWPQACHAFAEGRISSVGFRRLRAVMEVVETLGPCDGRHHARLIRQLGHTRWFDHPKTRAITTWGDPMRWPALLLSTPYPFPPTTLRYLSHALWLHDQGMIPQNADVVEIGVGYGGLAAMNAIVSNARTTLVDLPQVERAAMEMLTEIDLGECAMPSSTAPEIAAIDCVISNYAFTELSAEFQDLMMVKYFAGARRGMILSNAKSFSQQIGGRSDNEILVALSNHGIEAKCHHQHPLLSSSDLACGSSLITW